MDPLKPETPLMRLLAGTTVADVLAKLTADNAPQNEVGDRVLEFDTPMGSAVWSLRDPELSGLAWHKIVVLLYRPEEERNQSAVCYFVKKDNYVVVSDLGETATEVMKRTAKSAEQCRGIVYARSGYVGSRHDFDIRVSKPKNEFANAVKLVLQARALLWAVANGAGA